MYLNNYAIELYRLIILLIEIKLYKPELLNYIKFDRKDIKSIEQILSL